ncbi:MAG TPA: tRNA preQ1(34) S-adenosylmethionine ribosyltransferase-isomerase QueA [Gemmatimonadaceae bacterium]|nr:tRNA preQ1(34) S-adenosylmethionine ribosyltransferase-isomerase QueA [Gemmatimonadaceae bacterium]
MSASGRTGLRTSDYDFRLPPERIAQVPTAQRDESRLMVVNRETGEIAHHLFRDLPRFMREGDTLVLNTTRVFRARLIGRRPSGAPAEVFLLRELENDRWEAMVQPGSKLRIGRKVHFADGFDAEILESTARGTRIVRLMAADVHVAIATHGHVPLPPYIAREDSAIDAERYQTIFGRIEGSVAAPTAGLHFTPAVLDGIAAAGARRVDVLLHVGAGTFKPVEVDDPADHEMHEEFYSVEEPAAQMLNATRLANGRICAVGTTALRTIESVLGSDGIFRAGDGSTRIFIRPPNRPRAAEMLVTNFHLPRSTLIMLVAAMAGYDLTMHAYDVALRSDYRFYSYGDAMLVL